MIEVCACCNGCSSTKQFSSYPRYRFPKKLLVALSLIVIVAMCIMPAEARPSSLEHKRRHRRLDSMAIHTKETRNHEMEHRKRHTQRRLEYLMQPQRLRRPKNSQTDLYYNETKKIVAKLRNTRRFFNEDKQQFRQHEPREYKNAIPSWLPTVNFIEIHYHDYRSNRSRKNGSTIPERKFTYLMPKLYKSLVEYQEIFKRLQSVELDFPDDPFNTYKKKRKHIIQNTLYKLFSTIQEVNDSMQAVNMTVPTFNKNRLDLSTLEKKVDATTCIKNDYLALRGYGNLLNNWFLEFKCPRGKQLMRDKCQKFEAKLKQKISSRRPKSSLLTRVLSNT